MAKFYRVRSFTTEKEKGNNKCYTHDIYMNTRFFTKKSGANKAFTEECNIIYQKTYYMPSKLAYYGGRVVMEEMETNTDGEILFVKSIIKEKLYRDSIPYSTK